MLLTLIITICAWTLCFILYYKNSDLFTTREAALYAIIPAIYAYFMVSMIITDKIFGIWSI